MANDPDGEFINFIVGAVVNVAVGGAIRMATGGEFFDRRAMAMDLAIGAATSGFAAAANLARGVGTAAKIIHQTKAFEAVRQSARLWGKTEGVVWGLSSRGGRSMIGGGVDGAIVFEGQAAQQFIRRPIEGLWSAMKNFQGQYVTRFGDLAWNKAAAVTSTHGGRQALTVTEAQLVPHSSQWASRAAWNYWSTKFWDVGLTNVVGNLVRAEVAPESYQTTQSGRCQ